MTPEEIQGWINTCDLHDSQGQQFVSLYTTDLKEMAEAALRLSAIEAAGDEEVDFAYESASGMNDHAYHQGIDDLRDIAKSRGQQIAELTRERDEFREAARMVQCDIGSKDLGSYDRIPIFVSSLGKLMEVYEKGGAA